MLKAYHMESLKVAVLHKTQDSRAAQVWLYNADSLLWLLCFFLQVHLLCWRPQYLS